MKKSIFALFSVCLIMFSCKKHHDDTTTPVTPKPYMNFNAGTEWRYDVINNTATPPTTTADTITSGPVGSDTTVEQGTSTQRVYHIFLHKNGTHSYYANSGNDYYQFQDVAALGTQIQQLYLKDNVAANGSWSQDISVTVTGIPTAIPIHINNTITETGGTKTVYGITYNDVITVKTDITSTLLPGGIVTDIRGYYTRDIGLIEGDYNIDVTAATIAIHTQTLLKSVDLH